VELIKDSRIGNKGLFVVEDPAVEFPAQESFRLIKENNRLDFCDRHAYQVVVTDSVKNRDVREVGVIDLLSDRDSGTLCQWLKDHPEVTIVSRDRGGRYAKGGREGAP